MTDTGDLGADHDDLDSLEGGLDTVAEALEALDRDDLDGAEALATSLDPAEEPAAEPVAEPSVVQTAEPVAEPPPEA